MTLFLLIASGLFLLAALHPFITYPISLLVLRPFARKPLSLARAEGTDLKMALCFCAYNEERVMAAKINNLEKLRDAIPDLQILAYVDAGTDRTAELLGQRRDLVELYVSPERHGKTHGMNLLASQATAPLLIFTDANVMIDPEGLRRLADYFSNPEIGCVCGHLVYRNPGESITAATGSLYWRLEEWIKKTETELGSAITADGSLFAIRRDLHRPVPKALFDDMFLSLSVLCDGFRVVQAQDVTAYEDALSSQAGEFRRKARIACEAFNAHRLLWPRLMRLDPLLLYKYVSHKLLRWFAIYFLALAALTFEAALIIAAYNDAALILTALVAGALFAGWRWQIKPFGQLVDILLSLLGAGIGIFQSIAGTRYRIWTPSSSVS